MYKNVAKKTIKPIVTVSKTLSSSIYWKMVFIVFVLILYVTMVYGPIAAFLVELFPTKIRYTSMSLPYHIGNGVFGNWKINFSVKLDRTEKLDCINSYSYVDLNNHIQIYISVRLFKTYKIELEDIIKRIDFKDKV